MTNSLTAALTEAAQNLKTERYMTVNDDERLEWLHALDTLVAEVAYHLDRADIIPMETLYAARKTTGLDTGIQRLLPTSTELVLRNLIQQKIDAHTVPTEPSATERNPTK